MPAIERNVPIPPRRRSERQVTLDALPWSQMEIGDSFVYEGGSSGGMKNAARRAGIEIEIRVLRIEGRAARSFRIWRVK
jgi:hypothetical protein